MLTYQSEAQYPMPGSGSMRSDAMAGILNAKPYSYGQRHSDVYDALAYRNASDYDRAAQQVQTDSQLRQQEARRGLVLKGLSEMAEEQQRQNELANRRNSLVQGASSTLLGGLFR